MDWATSFIEVILQKPASGMKGIVRLTTESCQSYSCIKDMAQHTDATCESVRARSFCSILFNPGLLQISVSPRAVGAVMTAPSVVSLQP